MSDTKLAPRYIFYVQNQQGKLPSSIVVDYEIPEPPDDGMYNFAHIQLLFVGTGPYFSQLIIGDPASFVDLLDSDKHMWKFIHGLNYNNTIRDVINELEFIEAHRGNITA